MGGDIRKSAIAGSWYPGNPRILKTDMMDFFNNAPEESVEGEIVGLVAPHAGYIYSGQVAAYAYKLIRGKAFDVVIVIGPSHRALFRGVSVYNKGGYETPLGVVYVDESAAEKIMSISPMISYIPAAHTSEHSVEIQLPFLQVALEKFLFLPLVMGDQNRQTCINLAETIANAMEDMHCLVVGSSDLSHFHSHERAVDMDAAVLRRMENMDAEGLLGDIENNVSEACGGGPIAVTMMAARKLGANRAKVMPYANSGDITGEKDSVVGYASAVFYRGK
jgi:MEMO1 family protein